MPTRSWNDPKWRLPRDSYYGLSPGQVQAIILTNVGKLLIWFLGTNFSENSIEILTFSFRKIRLKVSSAKWRPFCIGLNVLTHWSLGADTKMCQESQVNTMVAVVVVPWNTRVKTVTTLIKYRKIQVLAVHEDPEKGSWGQHGPHLGPIGPWWAPMLAPWTLLSGEGCQLSSQFHCWEIIEHVDTFACFWFVCLWLDWSNRWYITSRFTNTTQI